MGTRGSRMILCFSLPKGVSLAYSLGSGRGVSWGVGGGWVLVGDRVDSLFVKGGGHGAGHDCGGGADSGRE